MSDPAMRPRNTRPLTAQRGPCGATLMPRGEVVATAGSRFLVLSEQEAFDLQTALADLRGQVTDLRGQVTGLDAAA